MMRMPFFVLLIFTFYQSHAQLKFWNDKSDIEKQKHLRSAIDTIVSAKGNEDRKAVLLYDLALAYILSENSDSISIKLEAALIGVSRLSTKYFYHEFQVHFRKYYLTELEATLQSPKVRSRAARIFFILSFPRDGIVKEYYDLGIKISDNKFDGSSDCIGYSSDIPKSLSYKKAVEDYFETITHCPNKVERLKKLQLLLFFSLKNI